MTDKFATECRNQIEHSVQISPPPPQWIMPSYFPSILTNQTIMHRNFLRLPSGLLYDPSFLPSQNDIEYKCVNDIQNRRRKMKKHKRRKWGKKYASLIRKFKMQREKKSEKKLQELFELWRSRTEAWDPAEKIEQRLTLARRSGYYLDILNSRGGLICK